MCLSADWAGILVVSNSIVHCFVLCVWVRGSRSCICSRLLWLSLFRLVCCLCASRVVFFSWCCGGSFLLLLLFGVFGVVAVSFFCPCVLGACGLARSLLVSPLPPHPPWLVLLVPSGPVSALLVPPSGYLVVSATVRLSYLRYGVLWLIGSCLHSSSWQQRLRPCVGLCPLHHVVGVVQVLLAPALRYSPLGDPETP